MFNFIIATNSDNTLEPLTFTGNEVQEGDIEDANNFLAYARKTYPKETWNIYPIIDPKSLINEILKQSPYTDYDNDRYLATAHYKGLRDAVTIIEKLCGLADSTTTQSTTKNSPSNFEP